MHAKGIRELANMREYFREYRAKQRRKQAGYQVNILHGLQALRGNAGLVARQGFLERVTELHACFMPVESPCTICTMHSLCMTTEL
jgi:hypothetical protein